MATHDKPLDVDFISLAIRDPDFGAIFQRNGGAIDFHNPETMQQLTRSTLKVFFGLKVELPADRLCPPVPVRFEYIRWIQSLIDTTGPDYTDTYDSSRQVIGLDIGVGASCIYPLLACSTRPTYRFGGTDIDALSLASAHKNVALNSLANRIRLTKSSPSGPIIPLDALGINQANLLVCNPPFYSSVAEMTESAAGKHLPPSAVCTGAGVEMVTEGGDFGFALRLFEESLVLRERVGWYSLMLGKLSSAQKLVKRIKEDGVGNWAVTCLVVGNVTRRWCVAWSFGTLRPSNSAARGTANKDDMLPFPTEFTIKDISAEDSTVMKALRRILTPLDVALLVRPKDLSVICLSQGDVWSRAARREKAREAGGATKASSASTTSQAKILNDDDEEDDDDTDYAFVAKITKTKGEGEVNVRWHRGNDAVIFESFCGMLKRELAKKD